MNKLNIWWVLSVLLLPVLVTGCELIGDIFEAGVWVGIIGVALLVFLVMWVIRKIR